MLRGEVAALTAAFLWALSTVIFGRLGKSLSPLVLNLAKGGIAIALILITLVLQQNLQPQLPSAAIFWLMLSGVIGIGLGDTAYFRSINYLGARRALLMECLAPPLTALIALVFFAGTVERDRLGRHFAHGGRHRLGDFRTGPHRRSEIRQLTGRHSLERIGSAWAGQRGGDVAGGTGKYGHRSLVEWAAAHCCWGHHFSDFGGESRSSWRKIATSAIAANPTDAGAGGLFGYLSGDLAAASGVQIYPGGHCSGIAGDQSVICAAHCGDVGRSRHRTSRAGCVGGDRRYLVADWGVVIEGLAAVATRSSTGCRSVDGKM